MIAVAADLAADLSACPRCRHYYSQEDGRRVQELLYVYLLEVSERKYCMDCREELGTGGGKMISEEVWEESIKAVLQYEGGFQAAPEDSGNWTGGKQGEGELKGTNFGISARAYPNFDIKNLTVEEAKEIYRKDYWEACRCQELPAQLAVIMMDCAVHQGPGEAKKLLQRALKVKDDGVLGPVTMKAAQDSGEEAVDRFLAFKSRSYHRILKAHPELDEAGWDFNFFSRHVKLCRLIFGRTW